MTPKKRIAVLIINRQFIRSWIDTGLITKLAVSGSFDVSIFAPRDVYDKISTKDEFKTENLGDVIVSKTTIHTIGMGLVNNRKLSETFDWKIKRQFLPQTYLFPKDGSAIFRAKWFFRSIRQIVGNTIDNRITILYLFKPAQILIRIYLRFLNEKLEIPAQIKAFNPDWLILPSASAHGITNDCIVGAKKIGLKTILAIDNWDHLTGKSTYPTKPDFFTVMGKRCIEHAVKIHDCDPAIVLPFGLPRFDIYREIKHLCTTKDRNSKFKILYCGFAMAHSEKFVVDSIADYFHQKYGTNSVEIHYRPHPGPSPRNDDYEIRNANVFVTKYEDLDRTAMPNMDEEFIKELLTSSVIVGAPTTLLIEAMLMKRPVVLDLIKDKYHRTSSGVISAKFTHILDLVEIDAIPRGETVSQLISEIELQIAKESDCAHYPVEHLYDTNDARYQHQLLEFLRSSQLSKID
jgi:hypothetical protein